MLIKILREFLNGLDSFTIQPNSHKMPNLAYLYFSYKYCILGKFSRSALTLTHFVPFVAYVYFRYERIIYNSRTFIFNLFRARAHYAPRMLLKISYLNSYLEKHDKFAVALVSLSYAHDQCSCLTCAARAVVVI